MAASLSTKGKPRRRARRRPTVDFPTPISPTSTTGRSRRLPNCVTLGAIQRLPRSAKAGPCPIDCAHHRRRRDTRRALLPFDAAEAAADPHHRGRGAAGSGRRRQCALRLCSSHRRQSSSRCRRLPSKPPRPTGAGRRLPPLRRQQLQRRPAPRSHLQRAAPTKAQSRKFRRPACSRRRRRSNILAGRAAIRGRSVA